MLVLASYSRHILVAIYCESADMEMALHGEGHEESGEGGSCREQNAGGGGGGVCGGVSPNRSALNGMGEFLLTQVGCSSCLFWWLWLFCLYTTEVRGGVRSSFNSQP